MHAQFLKDHALLSKSYDRSVVATINKDFLAHVFASNGRLLKKVSKAGEQNKYRVLSLLVPVDKTAVMYKLKMMIAPLKAKKTNGCG